MVEKLPPMPRLMSRCAGGCGHLGFTLYCDRCAPPCLGERFVTTEMKPANVSQYHNGKPLKKNYLPL